MLTLDTERINDLVERVQKKSAYAFSELYGATYEKQYFFSYYILRRTDYAKKALKLTYERAYKEIYTLSRSDVFMPWLYLINFDVCMSLLKKNDIGNVNVAIGKRNYSISNIKRLPVTEAMILLGRYYIKMPLYRLSSFLDIGNGRVKDYLDTGETHLEKLLQEKEKKIKKDSLTAFKKNCKLEIDDAVDALNDVLKRVGEQDSAIETRELISYSIFRNESMGVRARVLLGFTVVFAFLPLFFITPHVNVSDVYTGERGLPTATIKVNDILPVGKVEAVLHGIKIPVYEVTPHVYTIEAPSTGEVTVNVELFNHQKTTEKLLVNETDKTPPVYITTDRKDGYVFYYAKDEGVGMDFERSHLVMTDGKVIYSDYYDANYNYIAFPDLADVKELVLYDNFGNYLRIII